MTKQKAKSQFLNRGSPEKKKKRIKSVSVFILFLYHYKEWQVRHTENVVLLFSLNRTQQ